MTTLVKTKAAIPPEMRWAVWERDNFTCRVCGSRRFLALDHFYPESLGGPTTPANLRTLCRICNSRKHAKLVDGARITARVWTTWQTIIPLRPALVALLERALSIYDDQRNDSFCANAVWYGEGSYYGQGLKEQLTRLVGWETEGPAILCTNEAYDAAYTVVYSALPNCRNCWCMG
jgi:hypothetical protein